jgi:hypothetical protein
MHPREMAMNTLTGTRPATGEFCMIATRLYATRGLGESIHTVHVQDTLAMGGCGVFGWVEVRSGWCTVVRDRAEAPTPMFDGRGTATSSTRSVHSHQSVPRRIR